MPRHTKLVWLGLVILTLGAGCLHSGDPCGHTCRKPSALPPEVTLPLVQRGGMEALYYGLPAVIADENLPASAPETIQTYYSLCPKDCQCLAARCCTIANMMEREKQVAKVLGESKCCVCGPKANRGSGFLSEILDSAALEARNQQAGGALELYYRLSEAEAGADLIQMTLQELDASLVKGKELRDKMLITDEDYARMERQRYKALSDRTELLMNIEKLNAEIGKLICIRVCPGQTHLWPLIDLEAGCPAIDEQTAVQVALQTRGELQVLRATQRELNVMTLSGIRKGLASINSLLGSAEPQCKCNELQVLIELICKDGPLTRELPLRKQQYAMRIAEREQAIAADVLSEIKQIQRRCQTAALAKKRADSLAKYVSEIEERERKNLATSADVTKARLEWFVARGEVVKELAARERAKAKLKQHQGILPLECQDPTPNNCCPAQ